MIKDKVLAVLCGIFCAVGNVQAQEENLVMQFDFTNVQGTTVVDHISGINARVMNQAQVVPMGKYHVLDLGNGTGYLDMTQNAGKIVRSLGDFTVSVYYRVDEKASLSGAGYFLWCFSQSAANTQTSAPYTAYRLNAQRMATSTGGWGSEIGMEMGTASDKGKWIHMLYRQTGTKGELYLNGKRVQQLTSMPILANTFTAVPAYCWIGRAPFSGDSYLKQTLVADFRLYNVAVSDQMIADLASTTQSLEYEFANGGGGNNASLLKAINEAEQLLSNVNDYPEGAIVMLRDAVMVCNNIANSDKSQMLYDSYETELRSAIDAYKKAKGVVFDVSGITDVYDTERGFRHPGGLHTQADFERIKRQLAEKSPLVTAAWEKLKSAGYSQSSTQTYPVETIIRGGGTGENYLNAARGATMAYQNALRWKIEGTKANASAAVRILMAWARGCKLVSGDSNWALAAGLYGYEFAQAAELMRDYEGWSREDFDEFKQWMLKVWYPGNINFLRGRNGTWENYVGGQGGIRPGHYWSNWPLCNALAVISIGILCDDVFIYNQGMSFMKYDQVGTFQEPRTANPILSDGCTEFIGNLVVTTKESALETGAYGRLGQMQESGRDGGHAAMALGLAVDICKVAWNQGDDLFSYMDNRMAAGIEYVAACTQNVQGLPWTNYKYVDCRTAWHNGWLMTAPAEPAEVRNYWATVIGHYESVKGVKMPFAEQAYEQMGIDAGGTGGTSGPYDHLGYSVLMNTYDTQLCPEEKRPTLLSPRMEYNGKTIEHNELGGLRNTYVVQSTQPVPVGKTVKLMPQLPDGEEDTGLWKWNTGETTKDITVNTDYSYVYRATYTNKNGIESEQAFSIAVEGDCTPSILNYSIYANGVYVGDTIATVFYGDKVTLNAGDSWGWNPVIEWDNGNKGAQATYGFMATERTIRANVVNQGGRREPINFHIRLKYVQPNIILNGMVQENKTHLIATDGDVIVLQPFVPTALGEVRYQWSDGSTTPTISLSNLDESVIYTVTITAGGHEETITYEVFLKDTDTSRIIPQGNYLVHHVATDTYLTDNGLQQPVTFTKCDVDHPVANQIWYISANNKRHSLQSLSDSLSLSANGTTISNVAKSFYFEGALGVDRYAMHYGLGASAKYWTVMDEGSVEIVSSSTIPDFPFELIPVGSPDAIRHIHAVPDSPNDNHIYDLQGRRQSFTSQKGIYIVNGKKYGSVFHW